MDVKEIGNRIKQARTLRNLTLNDIASEIGVAKSTIQRYENGHITKPKLPVLQAIADSLRVNPEWLSGENVPMINEDSVSSIIENQLKKTGMSLEEVAEKANVSLPWLENIDSFIPGDMEFTLYDDSDPGRELAWDDTIGAYKSYEWISKVAKVIGLPPRTLIVALARQEIPVYTGPHPTAEEVFSDFNAADKETAQQNQNTLIDSNYKSHPKENTNEVSKEELPPEIRAAARGMMDLSPEDQKTAIDMIRYLSQKGKEAKDD